MCVTELFCVLHEVAVTKHRVGLCLTLLTGTLDVVNGPDPLVLKYVNIHSTDIRDSYP